MSTPRFLYHASAVGLSGEIRRPFQQRIDSQAATALPRWGGHAAARIKSFDLGGVVGHTGVATELTGAYQVQSNSFETTAVASVTGLNLEGVLTAGVLTASIHSSHPVTASGKAPSKSAKRSKRAAPPVEPSISIAGTAIKDLVIAGRPIDLEPILDISTEFPTTMSGLRAYYKGNRKFRDDFESCSYVAQEGALPEDVRMFFPWRRYKKSTELHERNGLTIIPLYRVKNPSAPGFEVYGNVIKVANFGRVHIGELIIESNRRRLLMLYADLGSPCEGNVLSGCVDGNGTDPPPPDGDKQ